MKMQGMAVKEYHACSGTAVTILYYYVIYIWESNEWFASRRKVFFPLAEVSVEVESLFSGNVSDHDRAATQPSKVKNITILVLKHD